MSCLHNWNIKCLKKGDTFKEKLITFPFSITGCTFLMQFRKDATGPNTNPVAFEWKSEDDSFEIDGADDKILIMKKKDIDVEPFAYVSDFQITYPNGDVETLFNAKIEIVEDYSRTV